MRIHKTYKHLRKIKNSL